jgi:orotate phosphoribosyltransferase
MQSYKQRFIEFMLGASVLRFGDFVTKSGRKTPFFINAGLYRTGQQMRRLGEFYADTIEAQAASFDFLFGPAYKGIPLAVATAMALAGRKHDVPFCFNRKEAKDHGEGGRLVGHAPSDGQRALIVEDVTTAGTSIRETVPQLRAAAAVELAGLVVSVDRMERGTGQLNALDEIAKEFAMPTFAIVTIEEVIEYLRGREIEGRVVLDEETHARVRAYRDQYGA